MKKYQTPELYRIAFCNDDIMNVSDEIFKLGDFDLPIIKPSGN